LFSKVRDLKSKKLWIKGKLSSIVFSKVHSLIEIQFKIELKDETNNMKKRSLVIRSLVIRRKEKEKTFQGHKFPFSFSSFPLFFS